MVAMARWLLCLALLLPAARLVADEPPVGITADELSVELMVDGKPYRLERIQDGGNLIDLEFGVTSRPCPPYCIQPMELASGVETIGELELIDYLKRISAGDSRYLVIDSRTGEWLHRGMIPLAVSLPWELFHPASADPQRLVELLEFQFNAVQGDGLWDFSNARTLILYCNGPWCGQSPTAIRALLRLGYPADRLKWYRMGMQGWKMLGLGTVVPAELLD
jgi:rhodanese-related sulfurtransferase